jgi:protein translocase SecG subunit
VRRHKDTVFTVDRAVIGVGGGASAYGGSSAIVEKNLTRITVIVAVLFFLMTYVLGRVLA